MNLEKALVWFRRDLRDNDHAALSAALKQAKLVYCVFVFDRDILDSLVDKHDRRVEFIHSSLQELHASLQKRGGGMIVLHGKATQEIPRLAASLGVSAVFANRDYEPSAKQRDQRVGQQLRSQGIDFLDFKDQAIFEGREVITQSGKPYTVFTPYRNAWLKRLTSADHAEFDCKSGQLAAPPKVYFPPLADLGFRPTGLRELGIECGMAGASQRWQDFLPRLGKYAALRDYPACRGVSYLSAHLRFGTISIRQLVRNALTSEADSWLNELIWRDFYFMILDQFPHVVAGAFKQEYDNIQWADADTDFAAWCQGQTGYPLVDAAMRQLNHFGWMHNRLRMVTASFLCKDLGISWQQGEAYFARQLIDFDLSANNGGWQWAASTGCDAQPYFRIFNPVTQSEKFDPEGRFIRRYLPELKDVPTRYIHAPWKMGRVDQEALGVIIGRDYPLPLVDHAVAREKTLARYGRARISSSR